MADYELSGNTLTFKQNVSGWSNGPVYIDSNQFTFTSCTITSGITITFDFSESTNITVSNCTINKSCTIGSNITDCVYDLFGILTINASQSGKSFKFNKINISGDKTSISGDNITILSDDHELNIISNNDDYGIINYNNEQITINNYGTMTISGNRNYGISNRGTISIDNYGTMTISGNNHGIYNDGASMTINNYGTISITSNHSHGIQNNSKTMAINNSGIMNINTHDIGIYSNGIGTMTINNLGIIRLDINETGIRNFGTMNISNYNIMVINCTDYGIHNDSNSSMTFNNSSIINLNLRNGFQSYEITSINISDSLFLIESSSLSTHFDFTSTPSTWNGITFTNSTNLSYFTKVLVDLNHYFKPQSPFSNYLEYPKQITLQSGEQYFCNKLKNDSEEPLSFELEPRGTLILQPHSSLTVSDHFELPEESTLIVSGEAKINDSIIRGQSAILLSSELNGRVLNNCNCTF